MTQMEAARSGNITPEMRSAALKEHVEPETIQKGLASGEIVLIKNTHRALPSPLVVGKGMRTKVNANLGTSSRKVDLAMEVEKARLAVSMGTDAVMDLSTGGDLPNIRLKIMEAAPVAMGTVPVYEAAIRAIRSKGALVRMTPDDLFDVLETQADEGVDFFTVHCGVTLTSLARLKTQGRLTDIVSRGGSFMAAWMTANGRENPLYEQFDRVLDIAHRRDVTLSLGDGLRPGSLADATDRAQVEELIILGELAERARERNIQVMIEGPGHVPINQIRTNIQLEKRLCSNAPFYVLGPLVTDVAPGYDHITSAIGGAIAGEAGADFLCYVTPGEHLKLPDLEDVRQGVIAARIAAHAADIAKGLPGALEWDRAMSQARKNLDWERQTTLSIDPEHTRTVRSANAAPSDETCTMCGEFCAMKISGEAFHHSA
ncbi:MAG TPA: phosphomethylpyrimidine synthase ThiC [bacterium]